MASYRWTREVSYSRRWSNRHKARGWSFTNACGRLKSMIQLMMLISWGTWCPARHWELSMIPWRIRTVCKSWTHKPETPSLTKTALSDRSWSTFHREWKGNRLGLLNLSWQKNKADKLILTRISMLPGEVSFWRLTTPKVSKRLARWSKFMMRSFSQGEWPNCSNNKFSTRQESLSLLRTMPKSIALWSKRLMMISRRMFCLPCHSTLSLSILEKTWNGALSKQAKRLTTSEWWK